MKHKNPQFIYQIKRLLKRVLCFALSNYICIYVFPADTVQIQYGFINYYFYEILGCQLILSTVHKNFNFLFFYIL